MRNIYNVHYIGFGNVRQSRCHDAENALQLIADAVDEIMCVIPYTLPVPAQAVMTQSKQLVMPPPGILPGLLVVTRRTERDDTDSQGPVIG